jgi:hypothetical protein
MITWIAPAASRLMASDGRVLDSTFARELSASPKARHAAYVLALTSLTFAGCLLAAHMHRPIVSHRYLLNFQVVIVGAACVLTARAFFGRRLLFLLVAALALAAIINQGRKIANQPRWDATATKVAEVVRQCHSSPVYTFVVPRATFSKNDSDVQHWAYSRQAIRHSIPLTTATDGAKTVVRAGEHCPAIIWVEHVDWDSVGRGANAEAIFRFLGLDGSNVNLSEGKVFPSDTGFVLVLSGRS